MRKIFLYLLIVSVIYSCHLNKGVSGFFPVEIDCLGVELDGSQTVLSNGEGRNRIDALEQAKKNAVNAVLFSGFVGNNRGCSVRPLILEIDGRLKNETYFNAFFKDDGEYLKYVLLDDEKIRLKIFRRRQRGRLQVKVSSVVRVDVVNLKKELIKENIIK
jgi:hypothetical protein